MLVCSQKHQKEQLPVYKKYLHKNLKFQVRGHKSRNKKRHIEVGRKDIALSTHPSPNPGQLIIKRDTFCVGIGA